MTIKKMSRRDFLKVAGITLGASALALGVGSAVIPSDDPPEPVIETPVFTYGEDQIMNKRILVAYATHTGSTVGVAAAIGETLGARGFAVDVKPFKENPVLEGYQAVILGSAVIGATWLPEAVEFVKRNRLALNRVPVALFSVHIMNLGADEASRQKRLAYLDAVRPLLKPAAEVWFAGVEPPGESRLARWAYRVFKAGPEGDNRDWGRIRGWAQALQA